MEIIQHNDTGASPPYDHYFSMIIPECSIEVIENQDLNCVTITGPEEEDSVHICDVYIFIKALQDFQEKRAKDPRYAK